MMTCRFPFFGCEKMTEPTVNLIPCASDSQAEFMRQMLMEAGIPASVRGTSQASALAMGGASTGAIFLVVPKSRVDDANRTLETMRSMEPGEPWHCGRCNEDVDAGFEICWSCQSPRGEVEQLRREPVPVQYSAADFLRQSDEGLVSLPKDELNPYAAPTTPLDPTRDAADSGAPSTTGDGELPADEIVRRAFNAAVIGFLIPFPLFLYSAYLLLPIVASTARFSRQLRRQYRVTWILVLVSAAIWLALIYALSRG